VVQPGYQVPFLQQQVIEDFQAQIRKYQAIHPPVRFQFSQQPPPRVEKAIEDAGGTYLSSHNEIMDFDLLVGKAPPFLGFGEVIQESEELEKELDTAADQVRRQIRDTFGAKLDNPSTTPKELDDIIQELWETGWDPQVGNLALFTRDLGLLLTEATLDLLGGNLIFRSKSDVMHWSIFWADQGVEAFPFHKALKCLTHLHGETMTFFVIGLGQVLEEKGLPMGAEMKKRLPKPRFASEVPRFSPKTE
jgi:hypothetical protein